MTTKNLPFGKLLLHRILLLYRYAKAAMKNAILKKINAILKKLMTDRGDRMTKERVTMPPGCKCQPEDWAGNDGIIPICKGYVESAGDDFCHHCNHDEACHAVADEVDNRPADERDVGELNSIIFWLCKRLGEAALKADHYSDGLSLLKSCLDGQECACIDSPWMSGEGGSDDTDYDDPSAHAQYCPHYMWTVVEAALSGLPFPD